MREKARDKGRLEDIIEYSHNVMKLIEGILSMSFKKTYALTMR